LVESAASRVKRARRMARRAMPLQGTRDFAGLYVPLLPFKRSALPESVWLTHLSSPIRHYAEQDG
jgi:hypothetical protein